MENGGSTQMLKTLRFHHENDEQLSRVFFGSVQNRTSREPT